MNKTNKMQNCKKTHETCTCSKGDGEGHASLPQIANNENHVRKNPTKLENDDDRYGCWALTSRLSFFFGPFSCSTQTPNSRTRVCPLSKIFVFIWSMLEEFTQQRLTEFIELWRVPKDRCRTHVLFSTNHLRNPLFWYKSWLTKTYLNLILSSWWILILCYGTSLIQTLLALQSFRKSIFFPCKNQRVSRWWCYVCMGPFQSTIWKDIDSRRQNRFYFQKGHHVREMKWRNLVQHTWRHRHFEPSHLVGSTSSYPTTVHENLLIDSIYLWNGTINSVGLILGL